MISAWSICYLSIVVIQYVICGTPCENLVISVPKVRHINEKTNFIEVIIHKIVDYEEFNRHISITFQPHLQEGLDYEFYSMKAENYLPKQFRQTQNNANHRRVNTSDHYSNSTEMMITLTTMSLGLSLLPGRSWAGHNTSSAVTSTKASSSTIISNHSAITTNHNKHLNPQGSVIDLRIVDAYVCEDKEQFKTYHSTYNSLSLKTGIPVAHIHIKSIRCPHLPYLPNIEPELAQFLKLQLESCVNIKIIKSKRLYAHHVTSLSMLFHRIPLFLIDGSDQNITDAAQAVDDFLAPHSVLDIVWEPYSSTEPPWFLLMPRPRGMPGHLFAMLDAVQWEHPAVVSVNRHHSIHGTNHSSTNISNRHHQQHLHKFRHNNNNHHLSSSIGGTISTTTIATAANNNTSFLLNQCNASSKPTSHCIMGCPDTFLSRMTGSGWGADAWHLSLDVRRALLFYEPFQAAPHWLSQFKHDEEYPNIHGYEYTYQGCANNNYNHNHNNHSHASHTTNSHFLDCYFLAHSPCPSVRIDPYSILTQGMNRSRVKGWNTPNIGELQETATQIANQNWWLQILDHGGGGGSTSSIDDYSSSSSGSNNKKTRKQTYVKTDKSTGQQKTVQEEYETIPPSSVSHLKGRPAEHAFYSFALRPNYHLRKAVHHQVQAFNLLHQRKKGKEEKKKEEKKEKEEEKWIGGCAAMHVRRGDSINHRDQSRAYIRVESYVRAGRQLLNAMNITTILLFTDSQSAVDEAMNCSTEYPDVCQNITFRYLNKTRFFGAEGGWENHFPSGNPRLELLQLQTEFALTQQCHMIITGESSYGEKLYNHMCCGYPLQGRGKLPQRCICPPLIQVSQGGFSTCEEGNLSQCKGEKRVSAKEFTLHHKVSIPTRGVWLHTLEKGYYYKTIVADNSTEAIQQTHEKIQEFVESSMKLACRQYDHGPALSRKPFCHTHENNKKNKNNVSKNDRSNNDINDKNNNSGSIIP